MKTRIAIPMVFCLSFVLSVVFPLEINAQNASFNYSYTSGNLGSTYSWIDCSSGGTEITSFTGGSDDGHAEISWPFSFQFYDDNYTTSDNLSIGTNGFIRLDGNASTNYSTASSYSLNSGGTELGQMIALGVYDNNFSDASSHLYYKTTGTSPNRIFTVEYNHVEIDYNDNKYADVQVSFYETSYKVVLKFNTETITKSGVDLGIHSGVSGYYNKWGEVNTQTDNTWRAYTIPAKALTSITYNQASTADVAPNSADNEILRLDFDVSGGTGTLNLNSIEVTSQNTSDADIASSGVKLYRTTSTTFSTTYQLGTAQSFSSGSVTFSSLSYDLPGGKTYIWVTFDIASSATKNNHIDASISTNDIDVASTTYPSSNQSPSGYRVVDYIEWDGSSNRDWTTGSNWSTGSVPTSSDNIVIPSSPSRQPILYDGDNGKCKDITINSGATLSIENTSSGSLNIYGNLTNSGTFTESSGSKNIKLRGSNKTIGGSGTWTSLRIRINSGTYTLQDDISVYKFVVGSSGTFSLGNNTLTVTNDLRLKDAADVLNLNTGCLDLQGNFSDYDGVLNANTGTFYYSGSTSQTIRDSYTYYNLKIKLTSSATRSLSSGVLSCTNLELTNPSGSSDGTGTLSGNLSLSGNITIGTNCKFDANSYNSSVDGNWVNNGSIDLGSTTTTFDGSSTQTISGANTFYNITVNKSGGNLNISHDISISHTLTLTAGNISLGSYDLTIGSSATISGGGSSSYIVTGGSGVVQKDYASTGSFTFYVGDATNYSPFTFNLTAGTIASGAYVTMNVKALAQNELSSTSYIERNWELHQSGISGSISYNTDYTYVDGDVEGIESEILPSKMSGAGDIFQDAVPVNSSTNTVSFSGLTSFSYFGARDQDDGGNLPIDLISFSGRLDNNQVELIWQTASELNNDYFIIERSANGIDFEKIGTQKGSGNSNSILSYSFIDDNPLQGIGYYRLKQVDFDGSFDYSKVILVENFSTEVKLWPNPANSNWIHIALTENNQPTSMSIFDVQGRKILELYIDNSRREYKMDISELSNGIYFLRIVSGVKIINKKFIVKR